MRQQIARTLLLMVIFVAYPFPDSVFAERSETKLLFSFKEIWDDTAFEQADGRDAEDFIMVFSPGLQVKNRTERLTADTTARIAAYAHKVNTEMDHVDQNYRADMAFRFSEKMSMDLSGLFDVSNRPDRDIDSTGILVTDDRRIRQDYGAGFDYTLTETAALGFSGGYGTEKWDSSSSDRQDLESVRAEVQLFRNIGQWLAPALGSLSLGYRQYDYETSKTDYLFASLGLQHGLSETVDISVSIGGRLVTAKYRTLEWVEILPAVFQLQVADKKERSTGAVGAVRLSMAGERSMGAIRMSHDIASAGSRGTSVQRSEAGLTARYRMSGRSAVSFDAGFFRNRSNKGTFSSTEIDEHTWYVRPRLQFGIYDAVIMAAGYDYSLVDDRVDKDKTHRNRFFLQVSYGLGLDDWWD